MIDTTSEIVPILISNMLFVPILLLIVVGRRIGRRLAGRRRTMPAVGVAPARARRGTTRGETLATPTPAPLTAEQHWQRIAAVLRRAVWRAGRAVELHAAAAVQIGAAEHAFARLQEELAGLVARPRLGPTGTAQVIAMRPRSLPTQLAA